MSRRRNRNRLGSTHQRRGAAVVEFAVVTPLFLLLLAGIIEFGQAFQIEHALSNASRRGARAAIVETASDTAVQQLVKSQCVQTLGVEASDVTVTIAVNGDASTSITSAESGDEVTVTVSLSYSDAAVGFYVNRFLNRTLSSSCTLERE